MTKVIDKKLLQLGIKASSGDTNAENELVDYIAAKHNLYTLSDVEEAVKAAISIGPTTEPDTTDTPQEAV